MSKPTVISHVSKPQKVLIHDCGAQNSTILCLVDTKPDICVNWRTVTSQNKNQWRASPTGHNQNPNLTFIPRHTKMAELGHTSHATSQIHSTHGSGYLSVQYCLHSYQLMTGEVSSQAQIQGNSDVTNHPCP